jgi:hypothetical protein
VDDSLDSISTPSASELKQYQKVYFDYYTSGDYDENEAERAWFAYRILCRYAPDIFSDKLITQDPKTPKWRWEDGPYADGLEGYRSATRFAKHCGDQSAQFKKLLKAKDPYIRTVGAVYLSFEDHEAGMIALRECAELPGGAGAWAALNLVRRGEKEAMPRALQLLDRPSNKEMYRAFNKEDAATVPQGNLEKRLFVLIANSCNKSGIPLPNDFNWDGQFIDPNYTKLVHWWEGHHDQVTIYDPWFEELAAQKID